MSVECIYWHTIHPGVINQDSVVIDLGANLGRFSQQMIERFGCRAVAIEASPQICKQIQPHPRLKVINCAVAAQDGEVDFHIAEIRTQVERELSANGKGAHAAASIDCR